jgi:hypothetical protein
VSVGEIAALVAAGAAVVLVVFLAVALVKFGRTMDEATSAIREARKSSVPLLNDADTAIKQVNTQLERVDGITSGARAVTSNVSVLSSLFTATVGGPLVRSAAFSYGLSRAIRARRSARRARTDAPRRRRRRVGR